MNDYMNPSVGLNPYLMKLQMQAQAQAQRSEQQRGPYTRNIANEAGMTAANEIIYRQFQKPIGKIQSNKAFMASTMGFSMATDFQKQFASVMTSVFKKVDPKELTSIIGNMMGKAGALAYLLPTSLSRVLSAKRDSFEKVFSRELGVVGSLYKTLNLMSLIRYPMRTLPAGLAMLAGFPNLAKLFPRPETLLTGAAVGAYKGAKAVGAAGISAGGGILNYLTGGAFGKGVGTVAGSAVGGQAIGVLKKVFGGIDARVLGVLSSPVGLSLALAGAQIGLAIWKSIKLARLLPSRKSPLNLERQYSDSMAYDAVLNRLSSLAAVGKIKPEEITAQASLINAQLLISIERHTSLLRHMAVEMDYKREEREKQGRSFNIDVLGQDPAGVFTQGLNKVTGFLHKTIAKYDPITQLLNFIFSGGKLRPRGEIARLERTYNLGQYGKVIKEQSKSLGVGLTESRLLTLDSNQIIQMGLSHEDKMEKLTQWVGELVKGTYSEVITLRKGFGFTKNVIYQPYENLKKFGHSINPLNLPGVHALSSLASAPFRAVGAVTRGIWRLPGAIRRMISPDSSNELSLGGGSQPALPVRMVAEGTKGKAEKRAFIAGERKFKNGEIDLSSAELVVPGRHGMRVIPLSEFDKRGRKLSPRDSAGKFTSSPNRSLQQELEEVAEKKEKMGFWSIPKQILLTLKDMNKSLKTIVATGGRVPKGEEKKGKGIFGMLWDFAKEHPLLTAGLGALGIAGILSMVLDDETKRKIKDKFIDIFEGVWYDFSVMGVKTFNTFLENWQIGYNSIIVEAGKLIDRLHPIKGDIIPKVAEKVGDLIGDVFDWAVPEQYKANTQEEKKKRTQLMRDEIGGPLFNYSVDKHGNPVPEKERGFTKQGAQESIRNVLDAIYIGYGSPKNEFVKNWFIGAKENPLTTASLLAAPIVIGAASLALPTSVASLPVLGTVAVAGTGTAAATGGAAGTAATGGIAATGIPLWKQTLGLGAGAATLAPYLSMGWEERKRSIEEGRVGEGVQTLGINPGKSKSFTPPPNSVMEMLQKASGKSGVPLPFLYKIAAFESGGKFNTNAVSQTGCSGLFQFSKGTWSYVTNKYGKDYGITSSTDRKDPWSNILMGAFFTRENIEKFQQAFPGENPTIADIYSLHMIGHEVGANVYGGIKFLQELRNNPDAQGYKMFSESARHNPSFWFAGGNRSKPLSLAESYVLMGEKMGEDVSPKLSAILNNANAQSGSSLVAVTGGRSTTLGPIEQVKHQTLGEKFASKFGINSNDFYQIPLPDRPKSRQGTEATPGEASKGKNMFELFGEAWKLAGEYILGIGMPTTEQVKAELAEVKETVMDVASSTTAAVSQAVGNVTSGSNNTNVNQVAGQSGDSGLDNFCLKLFNSLCVVFKEDYVKYPFSAEMFHSNNIS